MWAGWAVHLFRSRQRTNKSTIKRPVTEHISPDANMCLWPSVGIQWHTTHRHVCMDVDVSIQTIATSDMYTIYDEHENNRQHPFRLGIILWLERRLFYCVKPLCSRLDACAQTCVFAYDINAEDWICVCHRTIASDEIHSSWSTELWIDHSTKFSIYLLFPVDKFIFAI